MDLVQLNQLHSSWIQTIEENIDRLTQWEEEFVESCKQQLGKSGKLSERQAEILERIYSKTP